MHGIFDPDKFERFVTKYPDFREVFESKNQLVKLTQIRKQKNLMADREAHFPLTFVKLDKDEIKKKEKDHLQTIQNFTRMQQDLKKKR
jgi:hypothetical protein